MSIDVWQDSSFVCKDILTRLSSCGIRMTMIIVFFVTLIPCLMIVFWSERARTRPSTGPDVGLNYTDESVPFSHPNVPPPQNDASNDDDMPGPLGYQDPVVPDEMLYDDPGDDSPDLEGTGGGPFGPGPGPSRNQEENDLDLPSVEIEFQYWTWRTPHYSGGGVSLPVPEDSDSSMELIPNGDHPPYPMEVHTSSWRTSGCTRGKTAF